MRRASFPARRTFATGSAIYASDSTDSTLAPAILRGSCSATSTVTNALLNCAPASSEHLRREGMELSVAVRAIEAWLMADRQSFASFLGVGVKRIPREPEQVADPKHAVVELARESSKRVIREGLVPSEAGGRRIGPAYTDEVIQYVRQRWSPNRARAVSPSLARAFERCEEFARRGTWS